MKGGRIIKDWLQIDSHYLSRMPKEKQTMEGKDKNGSEIIHKDNSF